MYSRELIELVGGSVVVEAYQKNGDLYNAWMVLWEHVGSRQRAMQLVGNAAREKGVEHQEVVEAIWEAEDAAARPE